MTFSYSRLLHNNSVMSAKKAGERDEVTGQSALPSAYKSPSDEANTANSFPVSRIKKIIQLDDDIVQCSNNATFVIAMATVRHATSTRSLHAR